MILQTWDINVILWFQNLGDWLAPIMTFFTMLGYAPFYLLLLTVIYWCIDRRLAIRIAVFALLSFSINAILKQAIHAPRPYWVDPRIRAIHHASREFGMPSGHAQISSNVWLLIGVSLKKKWFWAVAIVLFLMIGISRMYLGVHFLSQVVIGWILGGITLMGFLRLENRVLTWMRNRKLVQQLLFVWVVSMFLLLTGGIWVKLLKNWSVPVEWVQNASVYLGEDTPLEPVTLEDIAGVTGGFLGFTWGAILMSGIGGFHAGGIWWKRMVRYVIGILCLSGLIAAFIFATKAFSISKERIFLYNSWLFSWACLLCFSLTFLIPLLFLYLKLVDREDNRVGA